MGSLWNVYPQWSNFTKIYKGDIFLFQSNTVKHFSILGWRASCWGLMIIGIFQKHSRFDQFDYEPCGYPVVAVIKLFALADNEYFLKPLQACQINHLYFLFALDLLVHDQEGKLKKIVHSRLGFLPSLTLYYQSFIAQEHLPEQTTHQPVLLLQNIHCDKLAPLIQALLRVHMFCFAWIFTSSPCSLVWVKPWATFSVENSLL